VIRFALAVLLTTWFVVSCSVGDWAQAQGIRHLCIMCALVGFVYLWVKKQIVKRRGIVDSTISKKYRLCSSGTDVGLYRTSYDVIVMYIWLGWIGVVFWDEYAQYASQFTRGGINANTIGILSIAMVFVLAFWIFCLVDWLSRRKNQSNSGTR
jgi:hypothetical protein